MMSFAPSMASGEVEAAEVLVGLARSYSIYEIGNGNGNGNSNGSGGWKSKGKRSSNNNINKKVRDLETVVVGDSTNVGRNSLPLPFDLNMDQAALFEDECDNDSQPGIDVKVEDSEPAELSSVGVHHARQNGGRSRHDLSEAEKEVRRVRRILANRESARQTIRRRQALYEELKRRSVELASENEELKRTKNLAVQEFQSIQKTNLNLKNKISQIAGLELGKQPQAREAIPDSHNIHPPNCQKFLPFSSEIMMPLHTNFDRLNEQENISRSTNQQLPWCILPYPWLFAVPNNVKNIPQLASLKMPVKDEETVLHARHVCSPSSVIPRLHDCPTSSNARVAFQCDSVPLCSLRNRYDVASETRGPPTSECGKKSDVVEAAAEARKRRREVIKLKNLHYDSSARRKYG